MGKTKLVQTHVYCLQIAKYVEQKLMYLELSSIKSFLNFLKHADATSVNVTNSCDKNPPKKT